MIKVLNRSSGDADRKDGHVDFSNLPTLVLWMIMDRLDFPNNLRFASVCIIWRDATLSYSKDVKLYGESPPWLMIKDETGSGTCEFISTSTGKSYFIKNPDLCNTRKTKTLFTKQGWLLLRTKDFERLWATHEYFVISYHLLLLNPFTGKKIELPGGLSLAEIELCSGAFTLIDGKPDLVVFAGVGLHIGRQCIKIWTFRVAADHHNSWWTVHIYENPPWFSIVRVVVIGQNIYIVSVTSDFLVFNLSSSEWFTGRQFAGDPYSNIVGTGEGVAWKFCLDDDERVTGMYRLNDNCTEWEKLKDKELYKCWFLCTSFNYHAVSKAIDDEVFRCLVAKGLLVREVVPFYDEDDANTVSNVILYNINKEMPYVQWVDMPSYCI